MCVILDRFCLVLRVPETYECDCNLLTFWKVPKTKFSYKTKYVYSGKIYIKKLYIQHSNLFSGDQSAVGLI